jgi:alpha-mannosidase
MLAETLWSPPIAYDGSACDCGLLGLEGVPSVVPSWAKPSDNRGWILRLNETLGRRGTLYLRLAEGWRAEQVDLRGRKVGDLPDAALEITPYWLGSVLLQR